MDDDEKVAALEWALQVAEPIPGYQALQTPARALLDAVRLIRANEYGGSSGWDCDIPACPECMASNYAASQYATPQSEAQPHEPECEVGSWVRAAARAGL